MSYLVLSRIGRQQQQRQYNRWGKICTKYIRRNISNWSNKSDRLNSNFTKSFLWPLVAGTTVGSLWWANNLFLCDNNNNNNRNNFTNRRIHRRRQIERFGQKLCQAVRKRDYNLVRQLLSEPQADPDARSPYGWAALHIATVNSDKAMVELLLQHHANTDIEDLTNPYMHLNIRKQEFSDRIGNNAPTQGWTPLHYAVAFLDEEIIRLLCRHGADPDKKDSRGYNCYDYLDNSVRNGARIIQILDEERERYLQEKQNREREQRLKYPLENQIKERIIGQKLPINSVASAIRRKLNGWHSEEHPLVFLFLGSSGVGKTELAKTLASILHDTDKDAFIRIDMSEFQHKHEVSKFIGSPPGYVGYEQGGQLTSKLKKYPNAIVLLDEVEKAHPDILTVMLQLFDEGRITDGKGETVHCKDAIFIMTSNLAQTEIGDQAELLRKEAEKADYTNNASETKNSTISDDVLSLPRQFIEDTIQPILKQHFQRDEFLGRINEILYFLPFSELELKELTEKELNKWKKCAMDRHNIILTWDEKAIDLIRDGYNMRYGARSIQHEVEKRIINQIAKYHESGHIRSGSKIKITGDISKNLIQIDLLEQGKSGHGSSLSGWFLGSNKSNTDTLSHPADEQLNDSSTKKQY